MAMELETIMLAQLRANNAMLRETLLLTRELHARLTATTSPTQTSPTSSPSPTAMPSTTRASLPKRMLEKAMEKLGWEAIVSLLMWAGGRLAAAALPYLLPGALFLGGLIWAYVKLGWRAIGG